MRVNYLYIDLFISSTLLNPRRPVYLSSHGQLVFLKLGVWVRFTSISLPPTVVQVPTITRHFTVSFYLKNRQGWILLIDLTLSGSSLCPWLCPAKPTTPLLRRPASQHTAYTFMASFCFKNRPRRILFARSHVFKFTFLAVTSSRRDSPPSPLPYSPSTRFTTHCLYIHGQFLF